jgi:hypothetical protein
MRISAIPLVISLALLAGPALADSSSPATSQAAASNLPPDTMVTLDTQQKLKQSLEQNGFENVMVTPSSYVVHAQAPDGSHIVMLVSPDQLHAIIEPATGSSSAPGGSPNAASGTNH